jgi:antitoxin (DNA-binding transcriptional repressor) of toxin-antitoxin stability system
MAYHGEEVIVAKNNLPLVELVARKPKEKRKLGLLEGQIDIPDDFLDEDEEINRLFYGGSS